MVKHVEEAELTESTLDALEIDAIQALVSEAKKGSVSAAHQALLGVARIREKGMAGLHRAKLRQLAGDTVGLAAYLAELGCTIEETADRLGHQLTSAERRSWEEAREARLLEVRAVELGRMRVSGDVPKWARR